MDTLTVLLVEDDSETCRSFTEYADAMEDITFVSITDDATKALRDIQDYLPLAIILDLELHHGSGTGLDILNGLQDLNLDFHPYILITTNNSSRVTHEYARKLGADFIMSKHQNGYSERTALDFLRMMKSAILHKSSTGAFRTPEPPALRDKRIIRRISSELNLVGISPKVIGYQYLIDAIHMVINEPTQNLCSLIGKKYNKTETSVERAMQNAINKAWSQTDIEELLQHYTAKIHSEKGTPTTTEFVYYYANKIKNEY